MRNVAELQNSGIGKDLVVLASGPSLAEIDTARLLQFPHVHCLSINTPDPRCWPTDYWMLLDRGQWDYHKELIPLYQQTPGTILCGVQGRVDGLPLGDRDVRLPLRGPGTWGVHPPFHLGRSSSYVAAQFGLYCDYRRVLLLGVDMCLVEGRTHFYESECDPAVRLQAFEAEARCWDEAVRHLRPEDRARIWFCSAYNPWDCKNQFRTVSQQRVVELIERQSDVDYL
jgi:hypothetical protein